MYPLPASHFLSQPRPDALAGRSEGLVDTSTLAAHDFDVDARTGFMPPQPPIDRLPEFWEPWERVLVDAVSQGLKLGETVDLAAEDKRASDQWRACVRALPILSTTELKKSEVLLRRAHHVLSWTMHFYINTLPPSAPIIIPRSISIPLLEVSNDLALPPLLTYSDDVLYNWTYLNPPSPIIPQSDSDPEHILQPIPTLDNLRCQTLFTSTNDEAEFYLTSARIELRGVAALSLMSAIMDEAFIGDSLALRRIAAYLHRLAGVINELKRILLSVREGCDPDFFYHKIRPWFKGEDSMNGGRQWVFEGIKESQYAHLKQPTELSGPSAGQSSLIHAIDIFLGVDHYSPAPVPTASSSAPTTPQQDHSQSSASENNKPTFMSRMQRYMPRYHRAFLQHLTSKRPLRSLIEAESVSGRQENSELLQGYNAAVSALREFRDAHLRIVALYIIGPSRRVDAGKRAPELAGTSPEDSNAEKGTGGTNAMTFLKGVRDRTAQAVISNPDLNKIV